MPRRRRRWLTAASTSAVQILDFLVPSESRIASEVEGEHHVVKIGQPHRLIMPAALVGRIHVAEDDRSRAEPIQSGRLSVSRVLGGELDCLVTGLSGIRRG